MTEETDTVIFFFYVLYHALLGYNHQLSAGRQRKSAFISQSSGLWAQTHLLALSIVTPPWGSTVLALQKSRDFFKNYLKVRRCKNTS